MSGKYGAYRCLGVVAFALCMSCIPQATVPPPASMRPAVQPVTPPRVNQLVPRQTQWRPQAAARDWQYIVLHHTASSGGTVESIDAAHRARKDKNGRPWLGIGYHFLIGNGNGIEDGQVEETFRWREQIHGAHAGSAPHNQHGIGIALVGNFQNGPPTPKQIAATRQLVASLQAEYGITAENIVGHSDVKATACPGKHFSIEAITQGMETPWFGRRSGVQQSLASNERDGDR